MNRTQKIAWLFVVTTSLAIIATITTITILYFKVGMTKALLGFGMIGLAGLGGLAPIFIKKDRGRVTFDERDAIVKEKAAYTGFTAAFLFTCFACMIPFFVLGPKASISVKWLPLIWIGTFVTQFFFYSLAILVQYGWGRKDGNK